MNEIVEKKRERKEKKPKEESNRITLEMYNAGKIIDEIAEERGLAVSTICSHLSSYIATGLLDINNFVSADKREKAMKLMEQAEEIGSVYQTLAEILTTAETSFFLAWMRERKKN